MTFPSDNATWTIFWCSNAFLALIITFLILLSIQINFIRANVSVFSVSPPLSKWKVWWESSQIVLTSKRYLTRLLNPNGWISDKKMEESQKKSCEILNDSMPVIYQNSIKNLHPNHKLRVMESIVMGTANFY